MESKKIQKSKRRALGRGLSALISSPAVPVEPAEIIQNSAGSIPQLTVLQGSSAETTSGAGERIRYMDITKLVNNPFQPRQIFRQSEIDELTVSIRERGVLQPVLVRPSKSQAGHFEIVAGERRWRAAKAAGLTQIPVITREFSNREALEIALIENIQRANLSALEEAEAYKRLMDDFSLSQREVADKVGKDRASVANIIRLLKLPDPVRKMLSEEKITMGHAKAILTVREPIAQVSLAKKVIEEGLSVRALEAIVSREVVLKAPRNQKGVKGSKRKGQPSYPEIVDRLRRRLGTKVSIDHQRSGRGKIEIEYFSEAELDRIISLITG